MVECVRTHRHELQCQHQIITGREVCVVPEVQHVGLLAIEGDRHDKPDRPCGCTHADLVLPSLVLRPPGNTNRTDAMADNVHDVAQNQGLCAIMPPCQTHSLAEA